MAFFILLVSNYSRFILKAIYDIIFLGDRLMKIKTRFPIEIIVVDIIPILFSIGITIYYLIKKEFSLLFFPLIIIAFFGILTFLIYLFSRFYLKIYSNNVEIRKFFKVKKYELNKCSFKINEINENINDDFIYELTVQYEDKVILKINSNSLDTEYRSKKYIDIINSYNNKN